MSRVSTTQARELLMQFSRLMDEIEARDDLPPQVGASLLAAINSLDAFVDKVERPQPGGE